MRATVERAVASLAYAAPVAAALAMPHPPTALAVSLAFPLALYGGAWLARRPSVAFHAGQALHVVAAFAVLAALLGLVARPGPVRFAGSLGSIPLDADGPAWARGAFWAVAALRTAALGALALATARGRDPRVPGLSEVPVPSV